jgi:hypothetical protein
MGIRLPSDSTPAPTTSVRPRRVAPVAGPSKPAAAPSSALRGKGLRISGAAASPAEPGPADSKPAAGLVGKLVGKLTGRTRR